jgi:hypothetical protein
MQPLKIAAIAFPALLVASCSAVETAPVPLTEKQSIVLAKQLSGKVAGEPVRCISDFNATNIIRVSDDMLLYRVSGNLVYQNNLRGTCNGLASDRDIMVTEQFGGQKCKGDLIRLVDRNSGMQGGFCSLGDFVPYRKEKKAG